MKKIILGLGLALCAITASAASLDQPPLEKVNIQQVYKDAESAEVNFNTPANEAINTNGAKTLEVTVDYLKTFHPEYVQLVVGLPKPMQGQLFELLGGVLRSTDAPLGAVLDFFVEQTYPQVRKLYEQVNNPL